MWVLVIYYSITFVVMLLSTLTIMFDMAMKRRGLIRVMVLCGTVLFVLGKAVAIGKAAGLWS